MPLEIELNATHRTFYVAQSRNSIFIIEEFEEAGDEAGYFIWFLAGAIARYSLREFLDQRCCFPETGEPLRIRNAHDAGEVMITTRLRAVQRFF